MPFLSRPLNWTAALLLLLQCARPTFSFCTSPRQRRNTAIHESSPQKQQQDWVHESALVSRRQLFGVMSAASLSSVLFQFPPLALAAADTTAEDKAKILKGYERLSYLLDNWDKLTTKCSGVEKDPFSGKPVCEKNPLVIQDYIGYKSMNDPLFKADKTLRRLEDLVPAAKDADYFDAIEKWSTAVEEASGMAYTSSWAGPQNPNGGDLAIDYYLERSKKQVTDARDALQSAISILELK